MLDVICYHAVPLLKLTTIAVDYYKSMPSIHRFTEIPSLFIFKVLPIFRIKKAIYTGRWEHIMGLSSYVQAVGTAVVLLEPFTKASYNVLDLSKQQWTLTSPNFPNISVPGKVPSHAHVDLYAANIISDPYVLGDAWRVRLWLINVATFTV